MPNSNEPRFSTHVAIIVDGNRRWAKQRMLPVSVGHKAGFDRLREITRYAVGDRGVFVLSLCFLHREFQPRRQGGRLSDGPLCQ